MPDVMQGVVAKVRLLSVIGDAAVVDPPVYAPFDELVGAPKKGEVLATLARVLDADPAE